MSLLRTEKLIKEYHQHKVVNDVTLEVNQSEVVGLLGPNGAGKTTSFYLIVGLIKPKAGHILLDNEDITEQPMYQRARKGIGYLSQEPSVFRKLSVEENILAILETLEISEEEKKHRLDSLLNELELTPLAKRKAYTLSGGERRRVEITRALVTNPSFLLLDEPFTGIDPIARAEIQEIIRRLKEKGLGILITDHNVRETLEITDRAYIIYEGKILFSGTASALVNDHKAKEVYLGEKFRL
ncbi:MAG: LPS export ABC transporter ATP-binding protein [Candidatus Edwardsbacteria bacterium]